MECRNKNAACEIPENEIKDGHHATELGRCCAIPEIILILVYGAGVSCNKISY
jgi:hypothetical protein